MALDGFQGEGEESSSGPTKTTYFQFENPDHPDSKEFENPEIARKHFRAARYIQSRMGTDRHNLVGEFLAAVHAMEEEGDEEPLQAVIDKLSS